MKELVTGPAFVCMHSHENSKFSYNLIILNQEGTNDFDLDIWSISKIILQDNFLLFRYRNENDSLSTLGLWFQDSDQKTIIYDAIDSLLELRTYAPVQANPYIKSLPPLVNNISVDKEVKINVKKIHANIKVVDSKVATTPHIQSRIQTPAHAQVPAVATSEMPTDLQISKAKPTQPNINNNNNNTNLNPKSSMPMAISDVENINIESSSRLVVKPARSKSDLLREMLKLGNTSDDTNTSPSSPSALSSASSPIQSPMKVTADSRNNNTSGRLLLLNMLGVDRDQPLKPAEISLSNSNTPPPIPVISSISETYAVASSVSARYLMNVQSKGNSPIRPETIVIPTTPTPPSLTTPSTSNSRINTTPLPLPLLSSFVSNYSAKLTNQNQNQSNNNDSISNLTIDESNNQTQMTPSSSSPTVPISKLKHISGSPFQQGQTVPVPNTTTSGLSIYSELRHLCESNSSKSNT